MGLAKSQLIYSAEDYLEIDRNSQERYEYLDGEIWMMAGESEAHADICTNLVREISLQLKGSPCRVRAKDTKVRSGAKPELARTKRGMFSYPDAVVICGKIEFHDEVKDVIVNPQVIIEVLSHSTGDFDRGEKFMRYRNWNLSLTDYILVAQDAPFIEHFTRQADNSWLLREYRGFDASFPIASINCRLQLSEVFDRVEFPEYFDDEIAE